MVASRLKVKIGGFVSPIFLELDSKRDVTGVYLEGIEISQTIEDRNLWEAVERAAIKTLVTQGRVAA